MDVYCKVLIVNIMKRVNTANVGDLLLERCSCLFICSDFHWRLLWHSVHL